MRPLTQKDSTSQNRSNAPARRACCGVGRGVVVTRVLVLVMMYSVGVQCECKVSFDIGMPCRLQRCVQLCACAGDQDHQEGPPPSPSSPS